MESNPFRVIPLLSDSSPRRGNLLFQVQGVHGEMTHYRGCFRRKPDCGFDDFTHVLEFSNFDICVV